MANETIETPIIDYLHVKDKNNTEKIVLPITKEKAITDKNGQRLDIKLEKMQRDISIATGGELPDGILYVPDGATAPEITPVLDADTLQGHSADYFAAKEDVPEPWDYTVPEGQTVTYQNLYRTLIDSNNQFILQKYNGTTWENVFSASDTEVFIPKLLRTVKQILTPDRPMQFLPSATATTGVQAVATSAGLKVQTASAANAWSDALNINADGTINIIVSTTFANNRTFTFLDNTGAEKYRLIAGYSNKFFWQEYVGDTWVTLISATVDGLIQILANVQFASGKYNVFENSSGQPAFRIYCDSNTNTLKVQSSSAGSFSDSVIFTPANIEIIKNAVLKNTSNFYFYGPDGTTTFDIQVDTNNRLKLYSRVAGGQWNIPMEVTEAGNVIFTKNITAPNIASATALTAAEQEITEQDIALIAAEQANTDLDLRLTKLEMEVENSGI